MVERTAHNGLDVGSIPTKPKLPVTYSTLRQMEFKSKEYHIIKTKAYLKKTKLFIFLNGINRNSNEWNNIEQKLKILNFYYYKIYNKISKNTIKDSIYSKTSTLVNGITFIVKPINQKNELNSKMLIKNFDSLTFTFLALKLNNKVYSKSEITRSFSLNYKDTKLLLFQFGITNLKFIIKAKII